jgi:hypothetical protein
MGGALRPWLAPVLLQFALIPAAAAQTRSECEDGIRFIRGELGRAVDPARRADLEKLLRDAERELGESEYDECMDAIEEARASGAAGPPAAKWEEPPGYLGADQGLPISLDDSFVPERGKFEPTLQTTYDRVRRVDLEGGADEASRRSGRHQLLVAAEFEFGLGSGASAIFSPSYVLGDAEGTKQGTSEFGAKWNFLSQGDLLPALAVEASFAVPFGYQNDSPETTLKLSASKALARGRQTPWVYADLLWAHAFNREPDARANLFAGVLGFAMPIASSTALMFDLLHEQESDKGRITNLVEIGLRHDIGGVLVGLGVGAGFGGSITDFRASLGIQKEF